MKKSMCMFLLALCLLPALAFAAPVLSSVYADDVTLVSGQDGWGFHFYAGEGGTLAVRLLSGSTGEAVCDVGAMSVEAGSGRMAWNGLLPDGSAAAPGDYMVQVQLKNAWGEESESSVFSLHIFESEAARSENVLDLSTLEAEEAASWEEPAAAEDAGGVPQATSFWDMNPDD